MPVGPGKYDDLCTHVRQEANALGVIVIVIGGESGDGFSVQAPMDVQLRLPYVLRHIAGQISESVRELEKIE